MSMGEIHPHTMKSMQYARKGEDWTGKQALNDVRVQQVEKYFRNPACAKLTHIITLTCVR